MLSGKGDTRQPRPSALSHFSEDRSFFLCSQEATMPVLKARKAAHRARQGVSRYFML